MAANMDTTGTIEMANALSQMQAITCLHKYVTKDEVPLLNDKNFVALSCGLDNPSINYLHGNFDKGFKFICLDVANGYSERFIDLVKDMRKIWNNAIIIAGNVVTAEMTEALILAGADIVKVGIGPGSVCTTRKITGVGYPQLSAVIECSDAAHGLGGHIVADGGCTCPGDVAKAFAAGADFVMLGGMLAGTDESGAEKVTDSSGVVKKRFYGMSSKEAMNRYSGGVANYRAAEGKSVEIEYSGPVHGVVDEILGGIRSACTYVGAKSIKDLPKCTTFVRVNRQLNTIFGG
jgi:GMP reductase